MPTEPTPTVVEIKEALAHISNLEREMLQTYAGQPGMNPYIWIRMKLTPIARKLQLTPTRSLLVEALALKPEEPVIVDREVHFCTEPPVKDMMETSKFIPKNA